MASSVDEFYEKKKLSGKKWPIFESKEIFFFFLKQMGIWAVSNKIQKATSAKKF